MKKIILVVLGLILTPLVTLTSCSNEEFEKKEMQIETNKISSVYVNTVSFAVDFANSEDNQIKIEYFESKHVSFKIEFENNVFKMEEVDLPNLGTIINKRDNVKIYLPKGEIETFNYTSVSGATTVNLSNGFEKAYLNTTSGFIGASNLNVKKELSIVSVSGGISLYNTKELESAFIGTTSGKIDVLDCGIDNLKLSSTSGGMKVDVTKAKIKKLEASETSGSLKVIMDKDIKGFSCSLASVSGVINNKFGSNNYGDEKVMDITMTSVSGSLVIEKK